MRTDGASTALSEAAVEINVYVDDGRVEDVVMMVLALWRPHGCVWWCAGAL